MKIIVEIPCCAGASLISKKRRHGPQMFVLVSRVNVCIARKFDINTKCVEALTHSNTFHYLYQKYTNRIERITCMKLSRL